MKFLNKIFNFLIALGLIGYGFFFYFKDKGFFFRKDQKVEVMTMSSIDVDKKVNEHLQATSRKIFTDHLDQTKMIEAAIRDAKKFQEKPSPAPDIPFEFQIHQQSQVFNPPAKSKQKEAPGENLDRQEYARQFIENARKGGYEIELSDEMEIIRATPIRKPSQEIDQVEILPSN